MFSRQQGTDSKHIFRYSELVFPRKIIINFFLSSAIAIYLFFSIAFLIHGWAVSRNEKVFTEQQSLQALLAKQAMEENIYEIYYNLDIIQIYFHDEILGESNDFRKNRLFQLIQTSRQEILGFLVSFSPGTVDYSNTAAGDRENVAKSIGSNWLKAYWEDIENLGKDVVAAPIYISSNFQLMGNIIPIWERGELKGLLCAVIDLKPMINRFLIPLSMGEYGHGSFITGDGTILFDENPGHVGRNIFSLELLDQEMMRDFRDSVLDETLGSRDFDFLDKNGKQHRRLGSWHSMNIGGQKLILLLTATELQVNKALFDFQIQIIALGIALVISVASINFVLIASRKRIVQENAHHLEVLVEQRTNELAISESRYQAVFQAANDAIMILKGDRVINFNSKALEMFGYEENELKQLSLPDISKEEIDGVSASELFPGYMREALAGRPQFFEWEQSRKDKTTFYSEVSLSRLDLGEEEMLLSIVRDVTERKKAQLELEKLNAELEQRVLLRTVELEDSNEALKDSLDKLRETQKSLVEAEKMASLALLVAGIAHEINTPVGIGVTAATHLMQQTERIAGRYEEGDIRRSELEDFISTARESLKVLLDNLLKASEHISSFKKVAVDQASQEKRVFNLRNYIDEVLLSLHPVLKKTDHAVIVEGRNDIEIECLPGALSQIITNLVMNSLKHGFEGMEKGKIHIEVDYDNYREIASLTYSDNGRGMDSLTRQKIFEPFFTTARGSGGSGLGMHIVYNIVTQSLKGEISCESSPGKGTIFTIKWPVGIKQA